MSWRVGKWSLLDGAGIRRQLIVYATGARQ